jgi:pyruvate formate lyase activating enzyme
MLVRAAQIGRESGLRFVYAGNLPGRVGDLEHTHCPACGERVITRYGYLIQEYRVTAAGGCPRCSATIPGHWAAGFEGQISAFPFRVI